MNAIVETIITNITCVESSAARGERRSQKLSEGGEAGLLQVGEASVWWGGRDGAATHRGGDQGREHGRRRLRERQRNVLQQPDCAMLFTHFLHATHERVSEKWVGGGRDGPHGLHGWPREKQQAMRVFHAVE